ncbi:DUF1801 domain-containing protein [Kineococcus sp. LSe6-4]|uniref:DUF1801 domain-containing protein n=1 Tax=Kineococcus halophytocola TaxID=3234027 RepID=A0ABV4H0H3_9ACTN
MAGREGTGEDQRLSAVERAAVKARAAEVRAEARRARREGKAAADTADVLAKIASMPDGDRELAGRAHRVVADAAPHLTPKLYYGQPGWAGADGKVVCFFRSGQQDKLRYCTVGFSPQAVLDEATGLWPTSYALTQDATEEAWAQLAALVARAAPAPDGTDAAS